MSDLKADSSALSGFSGTLAEHGAELERRVMAVQRLAGRVLGDSWSGVSAGELSGVFQRWFAGARGVWESLNGLAGFVQVSAGAYEVSEDELTAAAQNASSMAGLPAASTDAAGVSSQAPVASGSGTGPVPW